MTSKTDWTLAEQELHRAMVGGHRHSPQGAGLRSLGSSGRSLNVDVFRDVTGYSPEDLVVTVGAGIRLSQLNALLEKHRQWVPLEPVDAGDDSLGGAIAVGLNGWYCQSYGPLRDRVLGMRVVTPAFGPIFIGSKVVKSVAGYNLTRLFSGTRGSLGVITEVTLKVSPRPYHEWIWALPCRSEELSREVHRLQSLTPDFRVLAIMQSAPAEAQIVIASHGPALAQSLVDQLGEPSHSALPSLITDPDGMLVQGAVPRTRIFDLCHIWPDFQPVQMDCLSGRFFGSLKDDLWPGLEHQIHDLGGHGRVLRSAHKGMAATDHIDPLWDTVKKQYDPDGCLVDFWR